MHIISLNIIKIYYREFKKILQNNIIRNCPKKINIKKNKNQELN